jgi:hypothetical protein
MIITQDNHSKKWLHCEQRIKADAVRAFASEVGKVHGSQELTEQPGGLSP